MVNSEKDFRIVMTTNMLERESQKFSKEIQKSINNDD